jgi:hypothetical protein
VQEEIKERGMKGGGITDGGIVVRSENREEG